MVDLSGEQLNGKSTLPSLGQMRIAHSTQTKPNSIAGLMILIYALCISKLQVYPQIALQDEVTQQFCRCVKSEITADFSKDLYLL